MNLQYLIEVSAVWLVSYLFYWWWLGPEKLPRAKRLFLVAALLAGPLVPLLPNLFGPIGGGLGLGTFAAQLETVVVLGAGQNPVDTATQTTPFSWLLLIWAVGAVLVLGRLIAGWWQLSRLVRRGRVETHPAGYRIVHLPAGGGPFSYGNYLFWPADLDRQDERWAGVEAHELAHIRQRHTLDILLADLLTVPFWWNPLPYLFRRALRLQHEYLADAAATAARQTNVRAYAQLLLQHRLVGWVPRPGHAFHHSHLKNRILMLTQPRGASWKLLAIIPLFAIILLACNADEGDITGVNIAEAEANLAEDRGLTIEDGDSPEMFDGQPVYKVVEQMPIYGDCSAELASGDMEEVQNCSSLKLLTDIYENIKYPAAARQAGLEGLLVINFIIPADGGKPQNIKLVRTAADAHARKLNKEAGLPDGPSTTVVGLSGDDLMATRNEKDGFAALDAAALKVVNELPQEWKPGVQDGQNVAVSFNLPIKFKLQN